MPHPKSLGHDLTEGSVLRQMLRYALPMMLATALQQVYSLVDTIVVGQMLGSAGLASVAVASQLISFMTFLCIGFSGGAQVIISQYTGAKRYDELRVIIGNTFLVHILSALFFTLVGVIFCHPLLNMLNAPVEAYDGAVDYLIISSIGLVFVYGYNCVCAILRGMGDSSRPLVFIVISSIVNIVLDILFVGPLKMGAAGAALATIISQAIAFIVAIAYLHRRREAFHFDFKFKSFMPVKDVLVKICRQGLPQAIQMAAINVSFLFIHANVNSFGVAASAAFSVGSKIEHIPSIATQGFSNAVAAMVGQNFAAGKFDRIRKTTNVALIVSVVVLSIAAAIYLLFPETMFRMFTQDEGVISLAATVLTCLTIAMPANAMMNAYRGVVLGVGNAGLNLVLGIFDGVVLRVGLAYLLGTVLEMGLPGFIIGYSAAAYGMGVPCMIYYLSGAWKRRKSLVGKG